MRYLYTNEEGDDESRIIPSDFYYADLTGDWDSNKMENMESQILIKLILS